MIDVIKLPAVYCELSPAQRRQVRAEYAERQGGKCMYCDEPLSEVPPKRVTSKRINWKLFPPNFLRHPVHLQHCHISGLTEGAVHAYCNAVLWQYEGR